MLSLDKPTLTPWVPSKKTFHPTSYFALSLNSFSGGDKNPEALGGQI
jgi:hypothetical protein